MYSLKAYITKEIQEGMRTHKFLIVAIGILFFAIADPAILKLTPMILENQFGAVDPNLMKAMDLSQQGAMAQYIGDLFQLGTLVTVLTLAGLISSERSNKTLTIPASMGCKISAVVIGKLAVYGLFCMVMTTVGMLTAYYYGGIIFGMSSGLSILYAVKAGILCGIFYLAVLSLLMFFSSVFKKGFMAGILTLLLIYLLSAAGPILRIEKYLPSNLVTTAKSFSAANSDIFISLLCTGIIIAVTNFLAVTWLKRVELV